MPGGTLQILGLGTSPVPLDYVVAPSQIFDLIAAQADYDGSGAGVDFVPVVQIVSDAGEIMAQGVGPTITAGSSASVTFAPFLRSAASSSGGGITAINSPNGTISVSAPFGPTVHLQAYPFSVELGSGGGTAAAGSGLTIPFGGIGGSSLFDYSTATAPKPKNTGWYEFTFTASAGGAFGAGKLFEADVLATSSGLVPNPSASGTTVGDGGTGVAVSFSLPPVHMTTTDTFAVNCLNLDVVPQPVGCEFYAVLVRPN